MLFRLEMNDRAGSLTLLGWCFAFMHSKNSNLLPCMLKIVLFLSIKIKSSNGGFIDYLKRLFICLITHNNCKMYTNLAKVTTKTGAGSGSGGNRIRQRGQQRLE